MPSAPQRFGYYRRLSAKERENMSARTVLQDGGKSLYVDDKVWTPAHLALIRTAASYPEVERVLVHPGIKKKLCDTVAGDRRWLNKVRPFWGHHYHFHIRIGCPPGSTGCKPQQGTGSGDGCDKSLDWWFTDEPWKPAKGPAKPKARDVMTMKSLPRECQAVLDAPAPQNEAVVTVTGPGALPVVAADTPSVSASGYAPTPAVGIPVPFPAPAR